MDSITLEMWTSAIVLVVAYVLIFSEILHRTIAAIFGAVVMVGIGMWMGFYTQEAAILAVDGNTILLLAAMMMLVALLRPTGAFDYAAVHITHWAQGNPKLLLIYLSLAVSLISMILDNVTTVIVFAPLTVLICRLLKLNPMPYLMAEAMLSNIGGAATLVGDPPNLMIGSAADISFNSFLVHMGLPVLVVWLGTVVLMLYLFREQLSHSGEDPKTLVATHAIKDARGLKRILFALAIVVVLFFVHHNLHLLPAYASFIGLTVALLLLQPDVEKLFGTVNWSVLIFFAGLFIIVGGVESSGLLELVGHWLGHLAKDPAMLMLTGLALMWIAAILSAVVDNIPFTVTMIPVILGLESSGVNIAPLWWALALGVGLGGNGTHLGATANIIAVSESEKSGMPEARISPMLWMRTGMPVMFFGLILASMVYWLFFDMFTTA
ncbi:MAG: citrate transporter [gamma proteobacterium symbiont of Ctena orbiculata]|uniref:ArsB/NhaD family transporter n=1 Tax=Candidatus Thiodiazotropha taylori TaxID=2792791 RepID=A0A944QUZ9_9GAMM|nr:ArsB/NhaD family transporter [Candidatus Thiodiazotropha taylori]PUB85562.1 MAG: citrate transporter [gamma proteobacterium symbiont of Ctena orbiculata]MBT2989465.1 ArsB/NhaD family transporter [Candidatus Thiodiazotropha taylori]MBT2997045.1 ArsB/NhaD family transporter [Candidatus Thiodiazotropha taylori]MBT3002907.1 ArsB/NhaD family transporter [Candidatus Thiodiazotropha taylori]